MASYHDAMGVLSATGRTDGVPGPHRVFSYGSNGLVQLRERLGNPGLTAKKAELPGSFLCFAGKSSKWNGAVATVVEAAGSAVCGNTVLLSQSELEKLDRYEGTNQRHPYAKIGAYRRVDTTVVEEGEPMPAVVFVKNDVKWDGPPSAAYLEACRVNVTAFWPAWRSEVRDTSGALRGPETREVLAD